MIAPSLVLRRALDGSAPFRHAPTTQAKDRKRLLRLLIKDITVEKLPHAERLLAHIRWQGGACSDIRVQLPPAMADRVRYSATVVDRVRHLAQSLPDAEIGDRLNQEGLVSALGKPFTGSMIKWVRYRYQIPPATFVRQEELTVQQLAERFSVSPNVVYYWIDRGIIQARRLNAGSPYWITLNATDEQKLRDWVRNSCRIQMTSLAQLEVLYEITVGIPNVLSPPFAFGIFTVRTGGGK